MKKNKKYYTKKEEVYLDLTNPNQTVGEAITQLNTERNAIKEAICEIIEEKMIEGSTKNLNGILNSGIRLKICSTNKINV